MMVKDGNFIFHLKLIRIIMDYKQVPIQKIGTPFQRPSWRYEAIKNQDKYGFRSFCSRKKDNSGCLKRLINKGLTPINHYTFPRFFKNLCNELPTHLGQQLEKVWNKHFFRQHKRKIEFETLANFDDFVSWNIEKVKALNDIWLKRLILHVFNVEYSAEIEFALRMHLNEEYSQTKRFIGYAIFAGVSDVDISKRWNIQVKKVEALRSIFFDFSYFPKDKVAQWALLRQLADNRDIKNEDFALYKRVFEMGEVGLKAQVCGFHLDEEEEAEVRQYLSKSALVNTFNLNYCVRTSKDALVYNRVLNDLARLSLQKEEIRQKEAELRLTELHITQMKKEMHVGTEVVQEEDLKLLQDAISALGKNDGEPRFKPFIELHEIK